MTGKSCLANMTMTGHFLSHGGTPGTIIHLQMGIFHHNPSRSYPFQETPVYCHEISPFISIYSIFDYDKHTKNYGKSPCFMGKSSINRLNNFLSPFRRLLFQLLRRLHLSPAACRSQTRPYEKRRGNSFRLFWTILDYFG